MDLGGASVRSLLQLLVLSSWRGSGRDRAKARPNTGGHHRRAALAQQHLRPPEPWTLFSPQKAKAQRSENCISRQSPVTLAIMMEVTRHQRHSARLRHWTQGLQSSPLPLASRVCQHFSIDATRRRTMCSGCAQWRSQCGSCSRRHRQTGTRSSQPTIVGSASGEMVPSQCSPQRLHPVAAHIACVAALLSCSFLQVLSGQRSFQYDQSVMVAQCYDLRLERRERQSTT